MSDESGLGMGQGDGDDIYALREGPTSRPLPPSRPAPVSEDESAAKRESPEERAARQEELERLAQVAARSAPPAWLYFRRTFSFPFQVSSLVCTVSMSLWAIVALGLPVSTLFGPGPQTEERIAWTIIMVVSGQIVLLILWFLLGSSVALTILRDTSYDNDNVERWPGLSEGFGDAFFLIASVLISAGLGALVAKLGGPLSVPMASGLGLVLLFPIILLSMLETNSPINPFSLAVWQSVVASWRAWAMFYLVTLLGGAAMVAVFTIVARQFHLVGGCLVAGPLAALGWMIYFRLLGRLAWFCAGGTAEPNQPEEDEARQ
mgnify:FL=1